MLRIALLGLLLLALTAPPAPRAPPPRARPEPFPGQTWVVPAEGFVWRASSWPAAQPSQMFDFTVYLDSYEELPDALAVEVATVPDLGDDGTLADAGVIERYEARPLGGHADIFAARTRLEAPWL